MSTHLYLSALAHLSSSPLSAQCLLSATVGVLSHTLYFIRGYHDQHALSIILTHLFVFSSLLLLSPLPFLSSLLLIASYLSALFTSIAIYRLLFHPLRRFPGPFAAKITRLYGPYTNRHGRMHHEQNANFKRYKSNVVRIGPNELFILSTDAIQKIHAAKSGCRKRNAGVYNVVTFKGEPNLDSILDREPHRDRRRVWERGMTTKALKGYEGGTRKVVKDWLGKVTEAEKEGKGLNTSLFALLIPFDNMGRVGFSHDFGTVRQGKEVRMLKLLEMMFGQMAALGELVWPVAVMQSLGVGGEAAEFDRLTMEMADRRRKELAEEKERGEVGGGEKKDIFSWLVENYESDKPVTYTNKNQLYADAGVIMVGATDTIAAVLSYAFFHLANEQEYQARLFEEVKGVFGKTVPGELADRDLAELPLLEAIINETMRLENPVCNNAARTTPTEGIVLDDGTWIPGGVSVRVPGYAMQRSEKAFVHPDEFIPERWTTRPDLILDRAAFMPFLTGPNNCVGRRLALMVLRLVLGYTVYHYSFRFAPGEDGKAIYEQAQNHLILTAGPLYLAFEKRES